MSFLPINQDNDEAPTGQTTNAPGTETQSPPQTGGSVGEDGGGAAPKGSATASPTQFGSSASKLGDYLSANAPQIGQQADTISGNLNTEYGNINQGITNAANQFQTQVQGGYAANNPDAVNQAMADPTKFAADPNNVKAFQGQYNNAYTGPQNFEGAGGYADIQNQVGQAVQQGSLLGTQGGLQSYLQGKGNNPTQAMASLDSLLLRGNPEAQAKINTAAGQFGNLTGQLGTATAGANQSVQDAQKAAQDSAAYAKGQFNPYVQNFGNQITEGAATAEQGRAAYNTSANKAYSELSPLNQYLSAFNSDTGYNVANPFTSALGQKQISSPITAQNYATPEQYAQAQAIQQLTGNNAQLPIGQDTVGLAGTASQIPQAQAYNIPGMVQQIANDATNAQYLGNNYGQYNNPNLAQPSYSQQIANAGTMQGKLNPTAYENLLSQLMGSSNGYITGNANGPSYFNVGQSGTPLQPPTSPPPIGGGGSGHVNY